MINTFMLLLGGHALADYPLQGDFLSCAKQHKNPIPGVPFYQALAAHGIIHGCFVGLILQSTGLGLAEMFAHAAIDFTKCSGKISFNVDQALHVVCKLAWFWLASHGVR